MPSPSAISSPERAFTRRMDLMSLQLFVAVAELGSIGKAAEREFIAASAVSKRLSDLEAAVGAPLLDRHARGVSLTPAGQSLLHHARTVLFGLEQMQAELADYAQGVRGHVRVYANISAIVQFLPEDLGSFVGEHPKVKIDLQEHLSSDVLRAVHEGAADVGICHAGSEGAGLQTMPYRNDELVLIVPRGHALARQDSMRFEDTLDCDHVGLHSNSSVYRALREAAHTAGRTIRLRIQVTGLDALARMIQNNLGVGVMPRRAFELMHGVGDLRAVRLRDAWARREISVVARDFSTLPLTARLFVEHLQARSKTAPPATLPKKAAA